MSWDRKVFKRRETPFEAETPQVAELETKVDALEAKIADHDNQIAAEEKYRRRTALFGSSTALGDPALAKRTREGIVHPIPQSQTPRVCRLV